MSEVESNKEVQYSKWQKREMSSFVAQELLYDYLKGSLDAGRKACVEKDLQENPNSQRKLNQLKKGIGYLEQLRQVQVQNSMVEQVDEPATYLSVLLKKSQFERWPNSLKWSMEAFVVMLGIALFLIITPWDKALRLAILPQDQQVILAEVQKDPRLKPTESLEKIEKKEKPQFADDKKDVPNAPVLADVPTPAEPETAKVAAAAQQNTASKPEAPVPTTPVASNTADKEDKKDDAAADKKTASSGFLFRGQFSATNVEMIAPKIKEKIMALGGRKAGEVEIGWKKSESTYYYHFTIPEAKYDELVQFLKTYEDPKMVKEKHPRVLPDGILRLILTLEEKRK